jgi:hypothetical protein
MGATELGADQTFGFMTPALVLALLVANACLGFIVALFLLPRSARRRGGVLAIVVTSGIGFGHASLGLYAPMSYLFAAGLVPWLAWLPLSIIYGAVWRRRAAAGPLNKWLYMSSVCLIATIAGVAIDVSNVMLASMAMNLGLVALTFPLGVIGMLPATQLIHSGIATVAEAYVLAAPVLAVLGYLQWYVFLQWALRPKAGAHVNR